MKILATALLSFILLGCSVEINGSDSYFLVHGRNHIFKVYAPSLWASDMEYGNAHGIASFFKPAQPFTENPKTGEVYIYAHGWDKEISEASFEKFIKDDQQDVLNKFKDVKISKVDFKFPKKNHIIQAAYFVIENIPGRYKEDCIFLETKTSIINIVYSGASKELYDIHKDRLEEFISKFEFLSSDPDEIRKILEKNMKDRPSTKDFKVSK
jgi:hypothetical protein